MNKTEILKRLQEAHEMLEQDLAAAVTEVEIARSVTVHSLRSLQVLRDVTRPYWGADEFCSEAIGQLTGVTHVLSQQGKGDGV